MRFSPRELGIRIPFPISNRQYADIQPLLQEVARLVSATVIEIDGDVWEETVKVNKVIHEDY